MPIPQRSDSLVPGGSRSSVMTVSRCSRRFLCVPQLFLLAWLMFPGPVFRGSEGDQLRPDGGDAAGEVGRVGGLHQFGEFGGLGFGEKS